MYGTLFGHQWKKLRRSTFFTQGWGVKILLALVALYFLALFGAFGYFTKEIFEKAYPEAALLSPLFARFILYYILSDLVARFFLQDLSVLSVQHYLGLPISKKRIIHYLLQGSVFNFFNILPLFFILPWAIRVVAPEQGAPMAILWSVALLALALFDHYLAIYLKRILAVKAKIFLVVAGVVMILFLGDYLAWFSLQDISEALFANLSTAPYLAWWPIGLAIVAYLLNYQFLLGMTHLDRWQVAKKEADGMSFDFLERKGLMGMLMANELKLITRNRRTKTVLYMSIFFLFYGLIFYTQDIYKDGYGWLLFVGIFTSGIFMINYGQFLVSWESDFFDGILTRSLSLEEYFRSKYVLLVLSTIILYVLSLPYVYFGWKAFYINTASFLYNMGVNSAVLLFASTYNKKRIDLGRGSAFNYQGTGAAQFVIIIPLMVVPLLIFQGFNVFGKPNWGLIFLGLMGIVALLTHRYFIKQTVANFKEKRYINAAGYREKS